MFPKKLRNLDTLRVVLVAIKDHHRNLTQASHSMGAGVMNIHGCLLYIPFSSISSPATVYVTKQVNQEVIDCLKGSEWHENDF